MKGERREASESRTASRRDWPVRKYRLGEEPSADLSVCTTPSERIEMMWPLAIESWSLAGRSMPEYARSAAPILVVRRRGR